MAENVKKEPTKQEEKIAKASEQILAHQAGKEIDGKSERRPGKPVGVDIGTSKIVFALEDKGQMEFSSQRNAFFAVDYSKFTEGILKQNRISHHKIGESLIVYGDGAEIFANMLNAETRRPMRHGLLNPKEGNAIEIIKAILDDLVIAPGAPASQLFFSIPGVPRDAATDIIYHEAILKRHLAAKGYTTKSINEGLAVVFSELEAENFTGFGISAGGGMCNVCLAYLSVPLISFSLNKGGDYIDDAVASVTSEVNTRVKSIKETNLDLTAQPTDDVEDALHIYYDDLIRTLVRALKESVSGKSKLLKIDKPVPMVLSGGTVKPNGFKERFEAVLREVHLPIKISEVRIAQDPLNATAKGALIAAMNED